MRTMRVWIAFGQDDPITGNLINLSDMFAVAADDVHIFGYYSQALSLTEAPLPPRAEFIFKILLLFLSFFMIVYFNLCHLVFPHCMILGLVLGAMYPQHP